MADTISHTLEQEEEYKYMKLTSSGLSISNDSKAESFTTAIKVSRTAIVFNRLFRIIFGDESIEDFIRRVIMEILAEFLDFDRTTGTVKIKGHVMIEQDLTVDGTSNFVSEVYCGNNLTVSGDADFKGNVKSKGTMVGSELDNPTA
jgi:hypothetical protein